jgi:hypothetical protein
MTEHKSVPKTVPAHEIEVKTDPLVLKMGMAPSAVGPRKDLAGLRLKAPNAAPIYLVDPDGLLRWIPNPATYNNLFRDWNGVIISLDIPNITRGPDLTNGAVLARGAGTAPVYIVSNGIKRWITSPATMDKYYFNWNTVFQVPEVLVDFTPTGSSWS